MATTLTITFTDGSFLGETRDIELDAPKTFGRSRSVDIRLKDRCVSRKHIEVSAAEDGVYVKCLSSQGFLWNEKFMVAEGGIQRLSPGDIVLLGLNERFRVDGITGVSAQTDMPTAATRAIPQDRATAPTRAMNFNDIADPAHMERRTDETIPLNATLPIGHEDDTPTEDDDESDSCCLDLEMIKPGNLHGGALPPAPFSYDSGGNRNAGGGNAAATDSWSGTDSDGERLSETRAAWENKDERTHPWSMDQVRAYKEYIKQRDRFKRLMIVFALLASATLLGLCLYASWPRPEILISNPVVNGRADKVEYHFYDADGRLEMDVDFANNKWMKVEATSNSVDATTCVGRDRDVRFNLNFIRRRDPKQLLLSLSECAFNEVAGLERMGYKFLASEEDVMRGAGQGAFISFYERQYPGWCETQAGDGTPFYLREYERKDGTGEWHGLMTLLRNGDMVYRLLREIPRDKWANGEFLMRLDCNMTLHTAFLEGRWESPGRGGLLPAEKMAANDLDALFVRADYLLRCDRPHDWPELKRIADSLMVLTFNGRAADRERARRLLRDFRRSKNLAWFHALLMRDRAIKEGQSSGERKEVLAIRNGCAGKFSRFPSDVRSQRVNDPEVWPCQSDR